MNKYVSQFRKMINESLNEDVYSDEFVERADNLLYDLYELSSNNIDEKINNCQDPKACLILNTLKNITQYIPKDIIESWF